MSVVQRVLPVPDSEELNALVTGWAERAIYGVLYGARDGSGLTIAEIRAGVEPVRQARVAAGKSARAEAQHLDRRLRNLDKAFVIDRVGGGQETRYLLRSAKAVPVGAGGPSREDRAWALRHQMCAQCGASPTRDGVRLHVDHKIPRDWGGTNDRENLQALCSECNEGKKAYYATFDGFADEIRQAIGHESVYVRIGELLKAMTRNGRRTPNDLLEVVAEARGPQRYWEKRMRELRHLGWRFEPHMRTVERVRRTEWELQHWEPWPTEGPGKAVRRLTRPKGSSPPLAS